LVKYIFIINITFIIIEQYEGGGGHRTEWNSEVGHEQKKFENHWFTAYDKWINTTSGERQLIGECKISHYYNPTVPCIFSSRYNCKKMGGAHTLQVLLIYPHISDYDKQFLFHVFRSDIFLTKSEKI
jgi:hypothetical protein